MRDTERETEVVPAQHGSTGLIRQARLRRTPGLAWRLLRGIWWWSLAWSVLAFLLDPKQWGT
jgi:hypothetical protein